MAPLLIPAVISFAVHDTGALMLQSPWLPWLRFTGAFLAYADGRRVTVRGDEVTILCSNGAATYALGSSDADGCRSGSLIRAWGP